ncbi:MAG: ABC-2 family transporter protein [Bryobacterales bacterium]|nr:ABC-2 family transporter protein [Bryobacterales bacterium]
MRTASLIWQYFIQYGKVRMEYRGDFITSVVTTAFGAAAGIAAVYLIFNRAPIIHGWSFNEILFLYGYGLLPLSLFNLLSINLYFFGEVYIVQGKFDRILLRPVHTLVQVLFEQFRIEALGDMLLGFAVILLTASKAGVSLTPVFWLLTAIFTVLGTVLYLSIFLILTAVSFWMEDRVGIIPPVYNIMAFGRYPLDIYGTPIRLMLSWIIPFGFAGFYPVAFLLGKPGMMLFAWLLPMMTAIFLTIAITVWNSGVKNYSSTGS